MTQTVPRKWEYIASELEKKKAPRKVIDAAKAIDEKMVDLGLDWNTESWERYSFTHSLTYVVMESRYCTACTDAWSNCLVCKLGDTNHCTPRSKYPDNYFRIVVDWVYGKRTRNV